MMEFKKEEHIDIIRQMVQEELHEFQPTEGDAQDFRYKANLIEMDEILGGKDPLDEISVEKHRKRRGRPKRLGKYNWTKGIKVEVRRNKADKEMPKAMTQETEQAIGVVS